MRRMVCMYEILGPWDGKGLVTFFFGSLKVLVRIWRNKITTENLQTCQFVESENRWTPRLDRDSGRVFLGCRSFSPKGLFKDLPRVQVTAPNFPDSRHGKKSLIESRRLDVHRGAI